MCHCVNVIVFLLLISTYTCNGSVTFIKDLLQFNLAGHPILHQEVAYPFDPDVAIKRARQYQEINGVYGEKAIERLGLGIDGNDQERLAQQRARDEGHLGGLNYLQP